MTWNNTAKILCFLLAMFFLNVDGSAQLRKMYEDRDAENEIYKLSFYSPTSGYVAFRDWIGFTTDSGRTYTKKYITNSNVDYGWYNVNLTFGFGINGVKAFSEDTIIVYGKYAQIPAILYSTSGGNTFKLVFHSSYDPYLLSSGITDMVFPQNDNVGYAVDQDRILKTTNRGLTWVSIKNSHSSRYDHIDALDNSNVFVYSTDFENNQLLRTNNGGNTWQQIILPASQKIGCANFLTTNKGWIVTKSESGVDFNVYYTSNGGSSWIRKNDPSANPFYTTRMQFINDSTGYALGELFDVYKTSDTGRVWERLPRDNGYTYLGYSHNDMQLWNSYQIWAGGGHGFLEMTTNGGGRPRPSAFFKADTTNFYSTHDVQLLNFSNRNYQYRWFVNNTQISTAYNTVYAHDPNSLHDSVMLIVNNGFEADTVVKHLYFNPPIVVSSFTPVTGATGTNVTITGRNFNGAISVTFGGVAASSFRVISPTQINAVVGDGASGRIAVTTPLGSGFQSGFIYVLPPSINLTTSVSKNILCKSDTVTITIQNTESNVRYELIDSLNNSYGNVVSTGGTATILTTPISRTGNYKIKVTRLNVTSSAIFTTPIFIVVEHTKSAFISNSSNVLPNEEVSFYQRATEASSFNWIFEGGASISTSSLPNPQNISYSTTGQKYIMLVSTSGNGCRDTFRTNAVYVYQKPFPDDVCYASPLDSQMVSGHILNDFSRTSNNGFIITGKALQPTTLYSRYGNTARITTSNTSYIARYTTDGALRWTIQFKGGNGVFNNTSTDGNGNIYVLGTAFSDKFLTLNNGDSIRFWAQASDTLDYSRKSNAFILKLDSTGKYLWHTILYDHTPARSGVVFTDFTPTKIVAKGNQVMVIGSFYDKLSYYKGGVLTKLFDNPHIGERNKNLVLKINTDGTLLWKTHIQNTAVNASGVSSIDIGEDGSGFIVGIYEHLVEIFDADSVRRVSLTGTTANYKGYLVKFDASGKIKWHNNFVAGTSTGSVDLLDLATDAFGNSYVTGRVNNWGNAERFIITHSNGDVASDSLSAFFLAKYDSNGAHMWGVGSQFPYYGGGNAVYVKDDNVYAVGTASKNNIVRSTFSFTSTDKIKHSVTINSSEFFIVNYNTQGVLKRIAKSGQTNVYATNPQGLFADENDNFYIGVNTAGQSTTLFNIPFRASSGGDGAFIKLNLNFCSNSVLPKANAGADRKKCVGDTTTIGVEATGDSYYWTSNPAGFTSTQPNPVVAPNLTTSYYLTVTNNSGQIARDTVVVTVLPAPIVNAGGDQTICSGSSVTIGTQAVSGNTYNWISSPNGFVSNVDAPTVSPTSTTTYYLTVTNAAGCIGRDTVIINVTNNPLTPDVTISGPSAICTSTPATFTATPINGGSIPSFQWQVDGVNVGSNSTVYTTSSLTNGSKVNVVMKSSATCLTKEFETSNTITVTVGPNVTPTVSITSTGTDYCEGSNAVFMATATNSGTSPGYQWQVNGQNVGTSSPSYSNNALKQGDQVKVILTSSETCASPKTASSNVLSINIIKPIANAGPDKSICVGSSGVQIGTAAVSGYSYSWTPATGLNSISIAQPTANPLTTTTYILTASHAAGCSAKDTVLITAVTIPATPIVTQVGNVLTSSALAGNQWYKDGIIISGATEQTYTPTIDGNYSSIVTVNGCSSGISNMIKYVVLSVNPANLYNSIFMGPNPVSDKLYITYIGTGEEFQVLLFDLNGNKLSSGGTFTSQYTLNVKDLIPGVYIVQVVNKKTKEHTERVIIKQ